MNWLQPPFPCSLQRSGEGMEDVDNSGVKLTLGKRGEQVEGVFGFVFVCHHPPLFLIGKK